MNFTLVHQILGFVQYFISIIGILIIISGVLYAAYQYLIFLMEGELVHDTKKINGIRLKLGRVLILGLEFIVAADLIGTTSKPDYYEIGLVVIVVIIRTLLSFSINRELMALNKE